MIAFINERSLEQYQDWAHSLMAFLTAAHRLSAARVGLFRDSAFFQQPAFKQRFNGLGLGQDVRPLVRELVFGNRYYTCWRPVRRSDQDEVFVCALPAGDFQDESVSEAAERQLIDGNAVLAVLSAPNSAFATKATLAITKTSSATRTQLTNLCVPDVGHWVSAQRVYYDPASTSAPKDFQTVLLREPERFRPTGMVERRGRRVFEEIGTRNLYYVDDAHSGAGAHLEVFSEHGPHLGTADIADGQLNPTTRVNGRVFRL